jgi:uncharacterized protein (TIGR02611 family)
MTWESCKRWLKIVAGFALLPVGVVMLPLPGPGWLVIFLALAILAGEFVWARRLMDYLKEVASRFDPRNKKPEGDPSQRPR